MKRSISFWQGIQLSFVILQALCLIMFFILPGNISFLPLLIGVSVSLIAAVLLWLRSHQGKLQLQLEAPIISATSLQLLQHMLNDLPTRVYWRDNQLQLLGSNRAFKSDFDIPEQTQAAFNDDSVPLLAANQQLLTRDRATLEQQQASCNQQVRLELDTEEHWVEHSSVPLFDNDGRLIGVLGSYYDVSKIKAVAAEMETAKEAAERANESKSEFLANMSHEIRTPINAIVGMANLCLKTQLSEKQKRYLKVIDSSSQALLGVINDILDFSKIEAGKLTIETIPFDLEDVLGTLADMFAYRAYDKDLEFIINLPANIPTLLVGDPLRLNQVLVNLVSNAIKFTEDGEINVAVTLLDRQEHKVWLRISVTDTGIGMDEEQRANLFKAFTQADSSTTRKYGGTGLGLAISRRIIHLMPDGDIGVISAEGHGSTFYIELTLPVQQGQDASHHQTLLKKLQHTRILAIDDNLSTREMLYELLRSYNMDVKVCRTAEQALEILAAAQNNATPFDIALVDWRLPGMNGLEFCEVVHQKFPESARPQLILATGYYAEELAERALQVGARDFITKPYTAAALARVLTSVLSGVKNAERVAETRPQVPEQIQHAPILVVEDNEINQHVAREILQSHGFQIDIAENGLDAVEKVQQHSYAAVLMDIQMPVMDGYQATQNIRTFYSPQQLPIIAMTANAMSGDAERSLAAGMQSHIPKPIDEEQLLSTLLKWCVPGPYQPNTKVKPTPATTVPEQATKKYPQVKGIDFASAMARLQHNLPLYMRLIDQLVEEYQRSASKIADFISRGQQDSARRYFHSLKGAAGNLGLDTLQNHAAQLETFMAAGEIDKVADKISRVDALLEQAQQAASDLQLMQQRIDAAGDSSTHQG
ncbi:MAG: response regulator [Idiomarina sp.]